MKFLKRMFLEVWKELMLFIPAFTACQTLAFAAVVFIWSVAVLLGAAFPFLPFWKFMAGFAFVVALVAHGQLKAKRIIP